MSKEIKKKELNTIKSKLSCLLSDIQMLKDGAIWHNDEDSCNASIDNINTIAKILKLKINE